MQVATLPRFDNHNGWLEILPALAPAKEVVGAESVDYAVIGGGFTGLAAARRLGELNPSASIALIDAGRIGNNAAGRCSGFVIDQAHNLRAKGLAEELDQERDQIELNRAGQTYLKEAVEAHHIDCDWRDEGKIHGAATARGVGLLKKYANHLELLAAPHRWIERDEMRAICGTSFYLAGLHTPGTILIQPAALVRGLCESMPENVTVYENSPVADVEYGQVHRLKTSSGTVSAHTLVMANNGFGAAFGFFKDEMIPISTFGSMTRELKPKEIQQLGGEVSWGIIPADPFGTSVRRLTFNRILIRNIYSYSPKLNAEDSTRCWAGDHHRQSLANRFPMLPELEFEYTWGGALALSRNGQPVFGKLADRVYGSLCHNGVGIARGTICGKLLAEFMSGEDTELLRIMTSAGRPNRKLPEPFMGWGVKWTLARRRARAGLEL